MVENKGDIVIYKTQDGLTKINVKFEDETVWLTQAQLVELYQTSKSNISEHIKHIFEEGELSQESTVRNFRTVQIEGNREVSREQVYYNLDMIISLGKEKTVLNAINGGSDNATKLIIKSQEMREKTKQKMLQLYQVLFLLC